MIKRRPHHELSAVQARFADVDSLEITRKAKLDAEAAGFSLKDVIAIVQALEPGDFVKSETAHSPRNSRIWHDTYLIGWDGITLYLKFAGEVLVDVVLTSFKEAGS